MYCQRGHRGVRSLHKLDWAGLRVLNLGSYHGFGMLCARLYIKHGLEASPGVWELQNWTCCTASACQKRVAGFAGASVFTGSAVTKRRKTGNGERGEAPARIVAEEEGGDAGGPWTLQNRQPWADKEVEPARPTAEQLEWLEKEGFIKEPEEGAEPGPTGRVRAQGFCSPLVCAILESLLPRSFRTDRF